MNQEQAIQLALSGKSMFLTGRAGVGKSYTLNKIVEALKDKGLTVAKTASTGIAGTYINGTTIHSWAGIGIKDSLDENDMYKIYNNKWTSKRIQETDVLIIDEISMLHDYRFDMIGRVCSVVRDNNRFFGGIQLIVCGDFFQLPPVDKSQENNYCFNSRIWKNMDLDVAYLEKVYRSNDTELNDLLNAIRTNSLNRSHYSLLNSLSKNTHNLERGVNLYSKNVSVDKENERELAKIDGDYYYSNLVKWGNDNKLKTLQKSLGLSDSLFLKEGAKIMTIINNPLVGYYNGTICEITDIENIDNGSIKVRSLKSGVEMSIIKYEWKVDEVDMKGNSKSVAGITQYPIKLAYAMTTHRAQGATLDYANLDLTDVFSKNMGYVALSRVTSLDGLYLKGYNTKALQIDDVVIDKDIEFQERSKKSLEMLKSA